jgi:oxygen-independent coproporphyrinogen-3 oxidase
VSLGIYIHIPFCQQKCNYCHFISLPFNRDLAARYEQAVLREIAAFSFPWMDEEVNSIYFGGGTPSMVPEEHIAAILSECRRRFCISEDCEVSMEANPGTISALKAVEYRKAGVNRISMGAQSFINEELLAIGRLHTSDLILESLDQLRESGFVNINLDLMLGLPRQTSASWRKNLETIARLAIPHVSVYMLDLDEPCPLNTGVAEGSINLPEEDLVSDLYLETLDFLSSCGLVQYEISNFARQKYSCRHNLKYWKRDPVLGFGLGSHSFDGQSRYSNTAELSDYLHKVETGTDPVIWRESITTKQALQETFFLSLRLTEGVDWNRLRIFYPGDDLAEYENSLQELCARGLLEWKDSMIRLTASGMLLSNEVFQVFV